MNISLFNQLVELFNFLTDPLWELYNSHNGYEGEPFLGAVLLGVIVSTYPSQIAAHLGAVTYISSEMVHRINWWKTVIGFFTGKLVSVYLAVSLILWSESTWVTSFFENIRPLSVPVFLLLGISLLAHIISFRKIAKKKKVKIGNYPFLKGGLIGFVLSLFMDHGVINLLRLYTPWLANESVANSWFISFLFAFTSFVPVWIFSIMSYGFKLDTFLRKHSTRKSLKVFFGFSLIIIALNLFFLYQK
ncbi:hypothetical protein [Halobacillus amylolyticus]|uniref:Uncharacterized protein n=1 Tax=Halobacillus amylolyticus TaxID=2932259 RepID=A0ABY4HCF2_9BACI|nr:hypothetical protein [Halobacillus amylolyticus]UOR12073.1 hypothetical protein MUO15_00565 [Halobacillus amylolyticus]